VLDQPQSKKRKGKVSSSIHRMVQAAPQNLGRRIAKLAEEHIEQICKTFPFSRKPEQ